MVTADWIGPSRKSRPQATRLTSTLSVCQASWWFPLSWGDVGNTANANQRAPETIVPLKRPGVRTQRVFAAMPPRRRRETCKCSARTCRRIFSSRGKSAASGRVPGRAPSVPCWWRHSATRPEGRKASAVDGRPAPAARSAEFREPPNRWCAIPARAHLALQHRRRRTALLPANVARCSAAKSFDHHDVQSPALLHRDASGCSLNTQREADGNARRR